MEAIDSGRLSYTDQIPCSENASSMGGSQIWLDTKETLSVELIKKNDLTLEFDLNGLNVKSNMCCICK